MSVEIVQEWFDEQARDKLFIWPSDSLDLNLIKIFWHMLGISPIGQWRLFFCNIQDFKNPLLMSWPHILQGFCGVHALTGQSCLGCKERTYTLKGGWPCDSYG